MEERLKKQLAFALEIDKEKNILRQTCLSGHGRRENDAEHAWHMAIMAYLLREYANEEVDIARVMLMCLIHDIVEIDAGDTYAYDTEGLATQKAREDAAKERIYSLLPGDQKQELTALFDEFEACESPESRYAHAMDNLQPLLLNDSNQGADWAAHGVTADQVYGRQKKTRMGSEVLYGVTDAILQKNIREGHLKAGGKRGSGSRSNLTASGSLACTTDPIDRSGLINTDSQSDPTGSIDRDGLTDFRGRAEGTDPRTRADRPESFSRADRSGKDSLEKEKYQEETDQKEIDQKEKDKAEIRDQRESSVEEAFSELIATVARLRAPDGCPWDRAQTHQSLKAACVEEAAEVVSGINILSQTGKSDSLREELGDLLLQVLMHAQIAEEEGLFTLEDVVHTINEKMIRRHPHVFGRKQNPGSGTQSTADTETLLADWKQIKAREKEGREWEEEYLFAAFDEAEKLIDVARRRKLEK